MRAPIPILALLTAAPAAKASTPDDTGTICPSADGPGSRANCSRIRFKTAARNTPPRSAPTAVRSQGTMSRRPLPKQYGEGRTFEMELTDWADRLDRVVTIDDDVLVIIASWGPCSGCAADVDGNGVVAVDDLLAVVAGWGSCS